MLFYGSLSNNLDIKPAFNVYCENKCNWLDGIGQLKSFERGIER